MNTLMTPITRLGLIFAGLLVAGLCQATPFQGSDAFGKPGDQVTVSLLDEAIADLDSATIKVTYDPLFLMFAEALPGDSTPGFSALPGAMEPDGNLTKFEVSLAGPTILSGGSGSILKLVFNIKSTAPLGVTPVSFESINDDYDDINTNGHVHVIADVAVPESETMVLLLSGLLLMLYRAYGAEEKRSGAINRHVRQE